MKTTIQTDITYIDGFPRWGCYVCCGFIWLERMLKRQLSREEIEEIFNTAVKNDWIKHNSFPIGEPGWYRCFVKNPLRLFDYIGSLAEPKIQVVGVSYIKQPKPDFNIGCAKTFFGHHFFLADALGHCVPGGNPDPRIIINDVESFRNFKIWIYKAN